MRRNTEEEEREKRGESEKPDPSPGVGSNYTWKVRVVGNHSWSYYHKIWTLHIAGW